LFFFWFFLTTRDFTQNNVFKYQIAVETVCWWWHLFHDVGWHWQRMSNRWKQTPSQRNKWQSKLETILTGSQKWCASNGNFFFLMIISWDWLASLATCYLLLGLSRMSSNISIRSTKKGCYHQHIIFDSQLRLCLASQGFMSIHCLSIVTCIVPKMHKLHLNYQLQTHTWVSTSTKLMYTDNDIHFFMYQLRSS